MSLATLLAFERPPIDWHAIAPELTLLVVGSLITLADLIWTERIRPLMPTLAGAGLLATLIPILTLAVDGTDRVMFGGAYVIDDLSLVLKALFLIAGYLVVLLSVDYIRNGDYHENEYYSLLLSSLLGMVLLASSRDLITMFMALELLSIPAYMLAGWRKGGATSNEASIKYYLMGVFASAIMLYGMSLLFGMAGSTAFDDIRVALAGPDPSGMAILGVLFVLIGFSFKVSAVPFHTWAPDTYEGAPTPVTAFLAVASKAAGFVALLQLVYVAFPTREDVVEPFFWIMAALTMTVGNLLALRQTNIVRMLAYSGVAQGGFMLAPFAVVGDAPEQSIKAVVTYLIIYVFMNLGAFAVVLAVAARTNSGEISSYSGLFHRSPGLAVAMTVFLAGLAGIPPVSGWFAKFLIWNALLDASSPQGSLLAVVVAVNAVIAFGYYGRIMREMWMSDAPEVTEPHFTVSRALKAAIVLTIIATLAFGIYPQWAARFGDISTSLAL
ncbi:MAG: NADH-quinone oxidoreductase subunit N [Actinomycetia bacterium]|nr:NADH-quinone oxidoreductase subunit N [Actinomycetes bacterium]MCP4962137.1 NADH-quinone oxidoreductase subunit N [Actinomycetes bacterium]